MAAGTTAAGAAAGTTAAGAAAGTCTRAEKAPAANDKWGSVMLATIIGVWSTIEVLIKLSTAVVMTVAVGSIGLAAGVFKHSEFLLVLYGLTMNWVGEDFGFGIQ